MISRKIVPILQEYATEFRSVLVVGPRQSGKTTLIKATFPDKPYISLENPDERLLAENDSRAFLNRFPNGAILDEIQHVPKLMSYMQEILDNTQTDGLLILTGSNNILLQEKVSQSLAGRLGVLELYPLSYQEIFTINQNFTLNELVLMGSYPEIYSKHRKPELWYNSYIKTYIERDVRQIKNIENTTLFIKFLMLCAGRIGQQINLTNISNECGINLRTVQSWLSVLEQTYVIKQLQPYYNNFNKRIVKTPKLYFIDTGLACALLNIRKLDELTLSHFRGALVENFIIMESLKNNTNQNTNNTLYYWRDNKGVEIDLIVDNGQTFFPIEIKAAQTFTKDFVKNLDKINNYADNQTGAVIYDGIQEMHLSSGIEVKNWRTFLGE